MRRLQCRVGWHKWRVPGSWITFTSEGRKHVKGVQRCDRAGCLAVRDYHKTWAPKMDVVGPTRRIR